MVYFRELVLYIVGVIDGLTYRYDGLFDYRLNQRTKQHANLTHLGGL